MSNRKANGSDRLLEYQTRVANEVVCPLWQSFLRSNVPAAKSSNDTEYPCEPIAMPLQKSAPLYCPGPVPRPRKPNHVAPAGACDCHFHIFGPYDRFPLSSERSYTPPEASIASYKSVMTTLGIDRCVIVQPSVYGTDNSVTLDAARSLGGPQSCRIVIVIDENIDRAKLNALHEAGVRGVRFNLVAGGGPALERITAVARLIADFNWHVQLYAQSAVLAEAAETLQALPVDVVIDHFGALEPAETITGPSSRVILRLLQNGRTWIKLSGGYMGSKENAPWADMAAIARGFVETQPDRLVWGTNWPHPVRYDAMPNDGDLLDALHAWLPDTELLQRVLVDNPAVLYGFE
jgi:2-pyrone-4,6-dicarboxylate lactonase